jgi:hypothetical protein
MPVSCVKEYYVIKNILYGNEYSKLTEVIAVVTDRDVAEHFCSKYGYTFDVEEITYYA